MKIEMKMRKAVRYFRQKIHGVMEKYWARILDLALGAYLYDPEELIFLIHSFQFIVYLFRVSTMMNPYVQVAQTGGRGIHANN